MSHPERMAAVDATWLSLDQPGNRMAILGVMVLEGPVDIAGLERSLAQRLLHHRRFRQCAAATSTGAVWYDDPRFDVARHIRRARLPAPAGKVELQEFMGELAGRELDPTHPLWQFHIIEEYAGGAAIVARIHHAIADGIALIAVMLSLADGGPMPDGGTQVAEMSAFRSAIEPLLSAVEQSMGQLSQLLSLATNPARWLGLLRDGTGIAAELAWLLAMPDDSPTRLKGKPCGEKRVAWCEPLRLRDVKAVSHALDVSVNDILLGCVAGALRSYLQSKGDSTDSVELRALVPVNLRDPASLGRELGNHFGIVGLCLPIGIADPVDRVREVHARMQALKQSREAVVTLGLLTALGYAPQLMRDRLFDLLLHRATAVMTNVPGPQWQLRLAGAGVRQVIFWVPQSGDIGLGVSILSYNGDVQFGLMADAELLPAPSEVVERFAPELETLLLQVLMEHWPLQPSTSARATATSSASIASSAGHPAASR